MLHGLAGIRTLTRQVSMELLAVTWMPAFIISAVWMAQRGMVPRAGDVRYTIYVEDPHMHSPTDRDKSRADARSFLYGKVLHFSMGKCYTELVCTSWIALT